MLHVRLEQNHPAQGLVTEKSSDIDLEMVANLPLIGLRFLYGAQG